ncbi:uroporphyrinogen-III synthase [Thiomicrorhabdus sp. zzn3]|uniref:uroporphyrinogen-III synthase n=1 Tax=Thiomicrorhabdus sp. zzn3 TaxID=3039775 RepID=UPI002436805E|nr:uroporphyrinogen-III synthase [Thiomicrorhabdus sp. zzn3]MDG6778858.1 uroporphyrinogen-III synthase [Thiomicrorhabdus sp. zzn3]
MLQFTLLNTRPEQQSAGLQHKLQAAGGRGIVCPTLEIVPVDLPEAKRGEIAGYNKIIFISANAVRRFAEEGLDAELSQPSESSVKAPGLFAIGQATVKAGKPLRLNLQTAEGARFDSEALLARADLQSLQGQHVLIVKGEGGRDKLQSELEQRGAQVENLILYRRQAKALCMDVWPTFLQAPNPLVLATSSASLTALLNAVEQAERTAQSKGHETKQAWSDWLKAQTLIVFSERIRETADQQGWKGAISVVDTQSDEGIVQTIQGILRKNSV